MTKIKNFTISFLLAVFVFTSGVPSALAKEHIHALSTQEVDNLKNYKTSMYSDFFNDGFYDRLIQWFYLGRTANKLLGRDASALNVNIYDEVTDSQFFENRIGKNGYSVSDLLQGPEINDGPETKGPWVITKGKVDGINPGFFMRDSKGDEYLIKFDPIGNNELASGAEAIASRIYHAAGYNVPQYRVVYFDPSILTAAEDAQFYNSDGFKMKLTDAGIRDLMNKIERLADGTVRASASLKIGGDIKGVMPYDFYRKDDPNDFYRHINRREFRALPVLSSWVNNVDLRKGNTLSTLIEKNGEKYLKYYFLDFGSAFGSAGTREKEANLGNEFFFDYEVISKRILSLGLYKRRWEKRLASSEPLVKYPSIGYYDNIEFDPADWKPAFQHYSFQDMDLSDAFWAAKILMKFKPKDLEQLVSVAKYSNPDAEAYLLKTLLERQRLIGAYWFSVVSPLDDFKVSVSGDSLSVSFTDLEKFYELSSEPVKYKLQIWDASSKKRKLVSSMDFASSAIDFALSSESLIAEISKWNQKESKWNPSVDLSFEKSSETGAYKLSGIRHQSK